MKPEWTRRLASLALLAVLVLAVSGPTAGAQPDGTYTLTWNTIDGGGGTSTGGAYTLTGTIGQPDAGVQSGGAYILGGGFWGSAVEILHRLFLPAVSKNAPEGS